MQEKPKNLEDLIIFFKRRKLQIVLPMAAIFILSVVVALLMPSIYRSSATILIEGQEIPRDLVRSTVTGYADQRIEIIKHRVMSRASLLNIIEQYNLYPKIRQEKTTEDLLEKMTDDLKLEVLNAEVTDQRTGRQVDTTIAFTLSFEGGQPSLVQRVASELTSLFLSENLQMRGRNAKETTTFLRQEANKLSDKIEKIELDIASFKEENSGSLPELVQFNMGLLEQKNRELMDVDQQTRSLEERQIYLGGQLLSIEKSLPSVVGSTESILDPRTRLKALRSEFITLSALQSPEHPDLVKRRREITALEKIVGKTSKVAELRRRLLEEKEHLQALRGKFEGKHPDLLRSQNIISVLEQEIKRDELTQDGFSGVPENPTYIALQTQLASTISTLEGLRKTRKGINAQKIKYTLRIENSPMVERGFNSLNRDRDNLSIKYHEIRAKLLEAEVSEGLEKERKGERFTLVEPASLPEKPIKPNRLAIIFLGFVFASAAGLGFGALSETMDDTVYSSDKLESVVHIPFMGIIPAILNVEDRERLLHQRRSLAVGTLGLVILALIVVHFLIIPLDVIFYGVLSK